MINKKGQAFQKTFYSFLFLALVVVGLLSFSFTLQEDNDAANPLSNHSLFNDTATSLKESISSSETSSKTQQTNFNEENPRSGFGSIVLFGIVSAGKTFTTMIYSFFTLIIKIPMIVLGIDSVIVSALVTIMAITIIIGVWIVYKLGG